MSKKIQRQHELEATIKNDNHLEFRKWLQMHDTNPVALSRAILETYIFICPSAYPEEDIAAQLIHGIFNFKAYKCFNEIFKRVDLNKNLLIKNEVSAKTFTGHLAGEDATFCPFIKSVFLAEANEMSNWFQCSLNNWKVFFTKQTTSDTVSGYSIKSGIYLTLRGQRVSNSDILISAHNSGLLTLDDVRDILKTGEDTRSRLNPNTLSSIENFILREKYLKPIDINGVVQKHIL